MPRLDGDSCQLTLSTSQEESHYDLIATSQLFTSACGTPSRPLRVQAVPGQRINVTLLDFRFQTSSGLDGHVGCDRYGNIADATEDPVAASLGRHQGHGQPIFGCRRERKVHVLTSKSDLIYIDIVKSRSFNFALQLTGNSTGFHNSFFLQIVF